MQTRHLAMLAVLLVASAGAAQAKRHCRDTLSGGSIFNKCAIEEHPSGLHVVGELVHQWLGPNFLSSAAVVFVLALPMLFLGRNNTPHDVARLHSVKTKALHFLHRSCYANALTIMLYTSFRQHRPCECRESEHAPYVQVGSIYGMPSGDAMGGALVNAYLFDIAPFHTNGARAAAVALQAFVCMERMAFGFHSLGQVLTGTTLGVLLYYYSTRAPSYMQFVDGILVCIVGTITVIMDPGSTNDHFPSSDNLIAWFAWGASVWIFSMLMNHRHFKLSVGGLSNLRRSHVDIIHGDFKPSALESLMASHQHELVGGSTTASDATTMGAVQAKAEVWQGVTKDGDMKHAGLCFALLNVGLFFTYCIEVYDWLDVW